MVLAPAVGSSRVSTTIPSSPFSYFTAESVISVLVRHQWEGSSDELDDGGDAHAAADAERGQAALELTTLELVDQRAEDHRAGRTERVAHRDGTAVDVGDLRGDAEVAHEAHRHGSKGLVDLEQVDVVDLEAGLGQGLAARGRRSGEHDRRVGPGDGRRDDPRPRRQAEITADLLVADRHQG